MTRYVTPSDSPSSRIGTTCRVVSSRASRASRSNRARATPSRASSGRRSLTATRSPAAVVAAKTIPTAPSPRTASRRWRAPGYLVHAGPDELDLARFESLVAAAQSALEPARRAEILREALSLWRGTALAEFRDAPFAQAASRRLAELRLHALELRLEADLQLGEDATLVAELESLVAQEPLREGPRRQLMLALYRSGRQAEALERYREGRRLLVDELGIEPSPALQELEHAILRQDPALEQARGRRPRRRGAVVALGSRLVGLVEALCGDRRELVLLELAADEVELRERSARLERLRASLLGRGVEARVACFTSSSAAEDLARLASEQAAGPVGGAGPPPP